ncbi:MAG: hypothetical protein ACTSWY_02855 [Promethearchaeota archaeon]
MGKKSIENIDINSENLSIWKKIRVIISAFKPVLLSHHPLCEKFENHSFKLFGKKFCIGCFIGYPSGIIMLIVGYTFGVFSLFSVASLLLIGISLFSVYLLSIFGLTKYKKIKIFSKIPVGAGAAFLIAGIFSFPLNFWINFLIAFFLIQGLVGLMTIKRKKELTETCLKCEWKNDWDHCPGMRDIQNALRRAGFITSNSFQRIEKK